MLPVYSLFIMANLLAAIGLGYFSVRPARKNSEQIKRAHLMLLLLNACALAYAVFAPLPESLAVRCGFFAAAALQSVWSFTLLCGAQDYEALFHKNQQLLEEVKKYRHLYMEIKSMALSDGLTNIANRRNFDMFLKTELHRAHTLGKPVSLIIMDLDHFKTYNDTFGHLTGDKLLTQIGQILLHHVRPVDLPARYGGEEFSIILPDLALQDASAIAEKLRQTIETSNFPDHSGTFTAKITASFGIATYDPSILEKAPDPEKIISVADKALYRAKLQGRNKIFASAIFQ